jgi:prepilin-type N-terminal cleavage/methylation domain-containing protein
VWPRSSRARAAGFTLLELLVVITIIALLAAITTPIVGRVYARVRFAMERQDLERQLLVLPAQVRSAGRNAILVSTDPDDNSAPPPSSTGGAWETLHLHLPEGWGVQVPKPIIYHFNGVCDGGEVVFSVASLSVTYNLVAPLCRPIFTNAAAS